MITIKDLSVSYKDFKALQIQGTLEIKPSDRVGVIGSNGAGKSTFIKACLGLLPYNGSIQSNVKPEEMAVHMQHNEYVETMSNKSIMETILNTSYKTDRKLQELVAFFDFEESMKKKFKQLSGGQKQRFTLIMVLMQDAPITFFDEVTTGLDFETRQSLIRKIVEWYDGKDASIMFVTHYFEELEMLTNKLLILDEGKVVDFDYREALFAKYCGHSVITFKEKDAGQWHEYKVLQSPDNVVVIACANKEEEMTLIKILNERQMNFKRSDNDIEILVMNAIGGSVQ